MDQLPQLFSRLHSSQSSLAERESQPLNVSRRNYFRSRSGRSLYVAICNMHQHVGQNPDWFEKQLSPPSGAPPAPSSDPPPGPAAPGPSLPPEPACPPSSSSRPEQQRLDSGLVLNEVLVNTPLAEGAPRRNALLLAPGSSPSPSLNLVHSPSPSPDPCPSPGLPHCSLSLQGSTSR